MKYQIVNKSEWGNATSLIFYGILGVVVFGILSFFTGYTQCFVLLLGAFSEADVPGATSGFVWAIISFLLYIGSYVSIIIGANNLSNIQIMEDAMLGVRRIRTVYVMDLVSILLPFVVILTPAMFGLNILLMLAAMIISVVALIMMREACKELEEEQTWSTSAKRGARQLKRAATYSLYMIIAPIPMALILLIVVWIIAAGKGLDMQRFMYDVITMHFDAGYAFPFLVAIIFAFIELYWAVSQFVYKILGWYNIKNGYMMEALPEEKPATKAAPQQVITTEKTVRFCTNCGAPIAAGSKFCASCGSPVAIAEQATIIAENSETRVIDEETVSASQYQESDPEPVYIDDEDDDDSENRKKIWITVGCIVGGVAVLAIILILLLKSSDNKASDASADGDTTEVFSENEETQNVGSSESEDFEYYPKAPGYDEDDEVSEVAAEEPAIEIVNPIPGATALTGKLDGKYEIVLQFTDPDTNGKVEGSYYYTKYKSPISLQGELEGERLMLEEYTNGNLTGRFIGRMTNSGFDGIWTSADESTTRDCTLAFIK